MTYAQARIVCHAGENVKRRGLLASRRPVPTLLYGKYVRADGIAEFGEHAGARGSLGVLPAKDVMPIALANARARKFGAWFVQLC